MKLPRISSLFGAKNRKGLWFAVCPAAHGVSFAQIKLGGAMPVVQKCEYHPTSGDAMEAFDRACHDAGIKDSHRFTTLLSPEDYQMLLVDAPNVPVEELKTAVRWKIKDGLDFHIDDATIEVLQIPSTKYGSDRPTSLYAIAAANPVIQKRVDLFERAGLTLGVIDIPEMAQRNIAALFEQEDRALATLLFDESGALLTFTSAGELFMTRRIEINAGQLGDANESLREQYRDRVELELQRSLDYFDRQFNHLTVSRVLISAPDSSGLVPFLASVIERPLEKLDLSEVMDISAVPDLADSEFVTHVMLALGAALREERQTP